MTISLSRLQVFYRDMEAELFLHAMIREEFAGQIALISSFGADAALMLSLVADVDKSTPVFFLETGKHFPETLEYGKNLQKRFGLTDVRWLMPDPKLVNNIDPKDDLWSIQPNRCCWMRKVEPLNRAVDEYGIKALITGRKRYQTQERTEMENIELDERGIFRINPLATWSKDRVKEENIHRNLPRHPLLDKGYLSIGCQPCTLPVKEGQDERAGRWAHTIGLNEDDNNLQKTECGIHLPGTDSWSV